MTQFILLPQVSSNGYYPYSPLERQYGTQATIDTIVQICGDWYRNEQYLVGVGDISLIDGSPMPPHVGHRDGKNVDIRPMRLDHANEPTDITDTQYDREATRLLVQSLRAHVNVELILFNDTQISGVTPHEGHDNHLHVKMNS
jgi:murein endopeptidase